MLVAVCDQLLGTSTLSCLKIVAPFSLPIRAVRFSHSTASNGAILPSVKKRLNTNPACACKVSGAPACTALPCSTDFTVAIPSLQALGSHSARWDTPLFYSSAVAEVMRVHRAANLFDSRMRESGCRNSHNLQHEIAAPILASAINLTCHRLFESS